MDREALLYLPPITAAANPAHPNIWALKRLSAKPFLEIHPSTLYCTTTMGTPKKSYEAFENFAKEIGATFSTNFLDLSKDEQAMLREFALRLSDFRALESLDTPAQKFHALAEKNNLSIDDGDIELFLTVELSRRLGEMKMTPKLLKSNKDLREQTTEQALERVFTGLRHTGITERNQRALWESAVEVAAEILDNFNLKTLQNPDVNRLREDLMDLYERFLLWMRVVMDGLLSLSPKDRKQVDTWMRKMTELLKIAYKLNEPTPPADASVQNLLRAEASATERLAEYETALCELDKILPSHQKAISRRL